MSRTPSSRRAAIGAAVVSATAWALCAIAATGVWLHLHPGRGRVSTAAAAGVPLAAVAAMVAVVVFGVTRRWISTAFAATLVAATLATQMPLFVSAGVSTGTRVTVMQANLKLGLADVDALARRAIVRKVDILTLVELTPQAQQRLSRTALSTHLPYAYVMPGRGGVGSAIVSRYPLRETIHFDEFEFNNVRAVIDLPGSLPTAVYALHPIPPYPYDPGNWVREMGRIRSILQSEKVSRVVAAGDFNATWDHAQFRELLDGGYADAAEQSGAGWVPTYPADRWYPPLIGIDHIVARGFVADGLDAFAINGSDHRGIVADLVVR
ncbi:endonuclease/exonuclease/phosphatase family protein [Williamsia sp. CHRR-6]|uniref:endonuclease/exonuclease/phosphatase family protein n=1 Tax=Williamsia sp. CHRR-6 TaxID=2835871 RepID=UPI001BD97355|nr:endonuclease/exonuclease/phosphatase family protein [Williamsia sp. CHRR-6]MBT0565326.1 endonuclease/exonuclease/phosphatase family protein [Williamsia sp. CHRR-6]